jgi:hypothetical protein
VRAVRVWFAAIGAASLGIAAGRAEAGRSAFGWIYDTETMPERGVEVQQWIWEENHQGSRANAETDILWGPAVGVTDQLELFLPASFSWTRSDTDGTNFTFDSYGLEARYRLVSADPVEAPPIVPLIRVGVYRETEDRGLTEVQVDAVATYTHGRVHVGADLGFYGDLHAADGAGGHDNNLELHPGAGVSVLAVGDLRIGAEVFAQLGLVSTDNDKWVAAGPDLSWTAGRFWLTATYGIGISGIGTAPRLLWGIAF